MPKFIKFYAPWCAPCRQLTAMLDSLPAAKDIVQSVDIEVSPEVAVQHNVRGIPVLIKLGDDGKEIERITGAPTLIKLKKFLGLE